MTRKLSIVSSNLREPPGPRQDARAATVTAVELIAEMDPPEDFEGIYADTWRRIVSSAPHLTPADRESLRTLVDAIMLRAEAAQKVKTIGAIIKSTKGVPIQNPYLSIQNKQAALIARYSDALGLTFTARVRGKIKHQTSAKTFDAFKGLKDSTAV